MHFALKIIFPLLLGCIIYGNASEISYSGFTVVRNYGPDFLWSFAFTNCIVYIWRKSRGRKQLWWWFSPVFGGVVFEYWQDFSGIGTFDYYDLLTYGLGWMSALGFQINRIRILLSERVEKNAN